jgi:predicted AAA+ superfamily ATPase
MHSKCIIVGMPKKTPTYIRRTVEPVLERAVGEFPVVVLTGPRQSGKTTLLKHLFADRFKYVSLESPDIRAIAASDPRGLVSLYRPPVIFDEVQYAPEVLPYIKEQVDADRSRKGQFILTGSQNLLLSQHVSETLAGRAAVLRLLPLSFREATGRADRPMPWVRSEAGEVVSTEDLETMWRYLLRGGYPELWAEPDRDDRLWYGSFVQTYLERDVRSLRQLGDLVQFQAFVRALAARHGQLFNMTEVSRDLGVAVNTVKAWLSVLEATYQVVIVRPFYRNAGKRLVKTPKVFFTDSGMLCYLADIRSPEQVVTSPWGGAILEGAVVAEVLKDQAHRGLEPRAYFWRTSSGTEVDIVVETEGRCVPIEVKLSATPTITMAHGLNVFRKDFPDSMPGYVVHTGSTALPLGSHVTALPFSSF